MTAVAHDLDTIEHLDFDHEPTCTVPVCDFGRPTARWRVTVVCGCIFLDCQGCKDVTDRGLTTNHPLGPDARCRECRTPLYGRWRDQIIKIEPLP